MEEGRDIVRKELIELDLLIFLKLTCASAPDHTQSESRKKINTIYDTALFISNV